MIRRATKEDIRVIDGLQEFIESLELDILSYCSEEKLREVLKFVLIVGFSFSYHYDEVIKMKDFWFNEVVNHFELSEDTIIFDYDEALEGEFYLDTLYVFSDVRGKGIGSKLLTEFVNNDQNVLSLNVAQSNNRARKLYEGYGFYKSREIFIGHEHYDHLINEK